MFEVCSEELINQCCSFTCTVWHEFFHLIFLGITFVFHFLPTLFSYYKSLERNFQPSLSLASLIEVFDWSNILDFFCFLPRCQNQKNMNSEYQVCTFPHSCANVAVCIKKTIFALLNVHFQGFQCYLWPFILCTSFFHSKMLAFVERPSRLCSLVFILDDCPCRAINLYMATIVQPILTPDNAIQDMMAVEVRIRWRTTFWLFSVMIVISLFLWSG